MKEMSYIEHLEELRRRIIFTFVWFIVFTIIGFLFSEDIYLFLSGNFQGKLTVLGPSEILWIYVKISAFVGVVFTIPVAAFQLWLFVKPALYPQEQRVTAMYIPGLFVLFVTGISFGYFVIFPIVVHFLESVGEGMVNTMFTVERYFSFMVNIVIPFGLLFELPLVIMFLTSLGILNPYYLAKKRKYAYFLLIVIGVALSPPDFMSDFMMSAPLLLIYELSISTSKVMYHRRMKRMEMKNEEVMERG